MSDFLELFTSEIEGQIRNATLGFSQGGKLVLGGTSGPFGGSGGPPGGFVGQLPQRYVTYDSTEAATLSGVTTLVDNLNHIRYNIQKNATDILNITGSGIVLSGVLHSNIGEEIYLIEEKTTPVENDIIVLEDSEDLWNKKKVTIANLVSQAGSAGNIIPSGGIVRVYNEDLTSQVPAAIYTFSYTPIIGTVSVYINGLIELPSYYTVSGTYLTLSGEVYSGDTILLDYNILSPATYVLDEDSSWPFDQSVTGYGTGFYGGGFYGG